MRWTKRPFDFFCCSVLAIVMAPIFVWIAIKVKRDSPGPVFYISERMKSPTESFGLFKFRTMAMVDDDQNTGVTGGNKDNRITEYGAYLRKSRLDELPQLWNIVLGHMSLVGPRPPLREYVERFPEIYNEVLKDKPGVTGLASLTFSKHETMLLADCSTPEETDLVYTTRCIPAKAKLDLMYQRKFSPCLDYWIIWETLFRKKTRKASSKNIT